MQDEIRGPRGLRAKPPETLGLENYFSWVLVTFQGLLPLNVWGVFLFVSQKYRCLVFFVVAFVRTSIELHLRICVKLIAMMFGIE